MKLTATGETFRIIGRGTIHVYKVDLEGESLAREDFRLHGTYLDGKLVKAAEMWNIPWVRDGESIGVLFAQRPRSCPADTNGDGDCAACSRNPGVHGYEDVTAPEETCPTCGGDNGWYVHVNGPCTECGGRGKLDGPLVNDWPEHECPRCGGQGFLYMPEDGIKCPDCQGERDES